MNDFCPKTGLAYLWAINDACAPEVVDRHIEAFAEAKVAAVCLHPRSGLLLPYGGDDWFAFVRRTALRCAQRGVRVWLYDEDPYPSGAAGGRITAENPELAAHHIRLYEADAALRPGELFCFGTGKLLWCGLASADGAETIDLTSKVGMVRRHWKVLDPWNSRNYYPETPLYDCVRAWTDQEEFAVRAPVVPPGMRLVAFVAQPVEGTHWRLYPDSLNPQTTRKFIELTHERYRQTVGDLFGKEIDAIFLDEPKFYDARPWTPGIFEAFERCYGYDLRPRLLHLFTDSDQAVPSLTRLHYRQWCGQRLETAWFKPVAEWCQANRLALVGHVSPEDDPVHQVNCVGNLFPLQKYFALTGLDLIVPAVGDQRHPILSVGAVSAASVAQQEEKPGVLSESLACCGLDFTAAEARRILLWQTVMGMTMPVIHAAYNSVEGERRIDAPPDYGPLSSIWSGMRQIADELAPLQEIIRDARQEAPVAIVWPIRTFQMNLFDWRDEQSGLRRELLDLLQACLDRQVGVHFIDEATLCEGALENGQLIVGRAAYKHILVPSCTVLDERTVAMLQSLQEAGLSVISAGRRPVRQQTADSLQPLDSSFIPGNSIEAAVKVLPRLAQLTGCEEADVRCTVWEKAHRRWTLLLNIGDKPTSGRLHGRTIDLPPGEVVILEGVAEGALANSGQMKSKVSNRE